MYTSLARVASDRKRTSHGIGKSGDELILSGQTSERAKDSIGKKRNPMPEKFSFHKQSNEQKNRNDPSDEMKTFERPQFAQEDSRIKSAGRFELDTGWVELGYDEGKSKSNSRERTGDSAEKENDGNKTEQMNESPTDSMDNTRKSKGNIYVSFQSNYSDDDARKVKDRKAKSYPLISSRIKSNDQSFQTGATLLQAEGTITPRKIRNSLDRFSDLKGNKGTYDDVLPFHQSKQQDEQLKNYRESLHKSNEDRTGQQRSITAVQTYKNKKDEMKRNFNRKLNREIYNIKIANKTSSEDVDFWLLLRKKRIEEDAKSQDSSTPPDENIDNTDIDVQQSENETSFESKTEDKDNIYGSFFSEDFGTN
ncbi:MAG: hypothetical protein Q4B14_05415 [Clostridia bacterium]|nr:hypothetical protein [Clostridia bacterium]